MSYILDALKKSERERTLGAVPTLDAIQNFPRARRPRRAWWLAGSLIILLTLAGVGIYGVVFWDRSPVETTGHGQSALQNPPAATRSAVPRAEVRPATTTTRAAPQTRPNPQRAVPAIPATAPRAVVPQANRTPSMAGDSVVPTLDELDIETRRQLPTLVVNVVSYAEQPGRRFTMVNEKIYHEGQRINGQIKVMEIRREGVVLAFRGRQFVMSP